MYLNGLIVMPTKKITRRALIKSGIGLAALGTIAWLRPTDEGAAHSTYFRKLSEALHHKHYARPTLVIDKNKLIENIETLKAHIYPHYQYRIVAKSLPSIPLLKLVSEISESKRFMLFNEQFLIQVSQEIPSADILMGKPMPVEAARFFYQNKRQSEFSPQDQLQWLIDTPTRLLQYQQLAQQTGQAMRINIELDVGLHRGGIKHDNELIEMIKTIESEPLFTLSGLMGYEPHVVKLPGSAQGHLNAALDIYRQKIKVVESVLGKPLTEGFCLNTGGSPSYQLHTQTPFIESSPCNELSAGSCLVKPMDFDIASLADHQAASYIATPVLKHLSQTEIPGVDGLGSLMSWWNPNLKQSFFTYGGYWKANPISPPGLRINPVYGRSTNQEMLNGSRSIPLKIDDWVFLRPTQSEFVFLQFGNIAVYDNGSILEQWPVFS
ncbi:MAG: D-serine deaminase-like pyridoxal phosphate-dependent protein [Oleiphilaceae bacterium]|jgi:D-serine deaminase-like pyridoxal phosphate-dependent protein